MSPGAGGSTAFGAFLQASTAAGRTRARRTMAVVLSAGAHLGVLLGFVAIGVQAAPSPPEVREPIVLHLAPPRAARKAAKVEPPPRPARKAPRPVMVQPPPEIPPPVPEEEPEPPVVEDAEEAPAEDAGVAEEAVTESAGSSTGRPGGLTGGTGDVVLELKDVARAPAVLEQIKPEYPRQARWDRIEGLVILRVIIGLDGRVEPAGTRVVRSVPSLDAAAIAAIEQWRFTPAVDHSGRVVRVSVEVPIRFTLR